MKGTRSSRQCYSTTASMFPVSLGGVVVGTYFVLWSFTCGHSLVVVDCDGRSPDGRCGGCVLLYQKYIFFFFFVNCRGVCGDYVNSKLFSFVGMTGENASGSGRRGGARISVAFSPLRGLKGGNSREIHVERRGTTIYETCVLFVFLGLATTWVFVWSRPRRVALYCCRIQVCWCGGRLINWTCQGGGGGALLVSRM